ncbi:unnamed protein product [Paramecium sonneborni]|uniref:Uncharacterized protein n=1 Tax=Paramecium sonneborni TaxID=65129 RepID=A0A8S1NQS3_9CILI|nr:unnamed protein product [Paramecium sonneborni]
MVKPDQDLMKMIKNQMINFIYNYCNLDYKKKRIEKKVLVMQKMLLIYINTPSTKQDSFSLYNKRLKKKINTLNCKKSQMKYKSKQSLEEKMKIEEYFQNKKVLRNRILSINSLFIRLFLKI